MNKILQQDNLSPTNATVIDVLIIGAGISGIGAAYHLREQMPGKTFVLLEAKESFGGTWRTHTYPGVRSDSDLYTFGYRFKPWSGKPVAEGPAILEYLQDVISDSDLAPHIRYRTQATRASWSSADGLWSVETRDARSGEPVVYQSRFLWMCQGYYDHSKGYTPEFPGVNDFKGTIIHPQTWPEDLDYSDKRVVVIGSGATAATLVPNMADKAGHVTMLQRSPTYFWTGENRNVFAEILTKLRLSEQLVHKFVRWRILSQHKRVHHYSKRKPELVKKKLLEDLQRYLPGNFDIDKHFTPKYRPWQQRLAYVPDGDLFKAIKSGKVSVVTDKIDRFTDDGILTASGDLLEADIIVTATGFNLSTMGGISFAVDGQPIDFSRQLTYRGILVSDLPNMAYMFGYLRTSWTMRVDLVCDYIMRLMKYMDREKKNICTPKLRPSDEDMPRTPWISEEDFNPGYVKRGQHMFPRQGDKAPWIFTIDYYEERKILPKLTFDDGVLVFTAATAEQTTTKQPAE